MINKKLAESRGLSVETQEDIQQLQNDLDNLLENPNDFFSTPQQVVAQIEKCEFTLQRLWGFSEDVNYHSYWFRVKGCKCSEMDNRDPLYFGKRIRHTKCPYHGELHENFDFLNTVD